MLLSNRIPFAARQIPIGKFRKRIIVLYPGSAVFFNNHLSDLNVASTSTNYHIPQQSYCTSSSNNNDSTTPTQQVDGSQRKPKFQPDFQYFLTNAAMQNSSLHSNNAPGDASSETSTGHSYLGADVLSGRGKKVYFETFGCQMNVNDMEIVRSVLKSSGYEESTVLQEAQVALVMTCAIREGAEDTIRRRIKHLKMNSRTEENKKGVKIGILGCMAERLKSSLFEQERAVSLIAGPDAYRDLPLLLADLESGNSGNVANVLLSQDETYGDIPPVRADPNSVEAFVSIMRGCDNMCTYCIVPFTRGRERSRDLTSIIENCRILEDQGVKEITLLGQNVNSYRDMSESVHYNSMKRSGLAEEYDNEENGGDDQMIPSKVQDVLRKNKPTEMVPGFKTVYRAKKGGRRFVDLLDVLSDRFPDIRFRFTSPHPKDFPDPVLHLIKERVNICNQLHLPAQSGDDKVLEAMGRGYTRQLYLNLVNNVKEILGNDIWLSSDFIAGFCGETEEAHQNTLSLIREVGYRRCFCFGYSMREKTRAHRRLIDDVPKEVKNRRTRELIQVYREMAHKKHAEQTGNTELVLLTRKSKRNENEWEGRCDGGSKVIIAERSPVNQSVLSPGQYVAVKIEEVTSQTLRGVGLYRTNIKGHILSAGNDHFVVGDQNKHIQAAF